VKLSIGNANYIAGKHFLAKHQECIYSFTYKRSGHEQPHYDFQKMFLVENRLLEVTAYSKLKYGPLGDYTNVQVHYDGQLISKFNCFLSYMGGGSNGIYPYIKTVLGHIIFSFQIAPSKDENVWSIDYYSNLLLQPDDQITREVRNLSSQMKDCYTGYSFNDLEAIKRISWIYPAYDIYTEKYLGAVSFCEYPGLNQYHYWVTGKFRMGEKIPYPLKIEKTKDNQFLQTLEFNNNDIFERVIISESPVKGITRKEFLKRPF
jgi:hypothetical protein